MDFCGEFKAGWEQWVRALRHFLQLVTLRKGHKPLLLKSPGHTARVEVLLKIFPQARLLHIGRDLHEIRYEDLLQIPLQCSRRATLRCTWGILGGPDAR